MKMKKVMAIALAASMMLGMVEPATVYASSGETEVIETAGEETEEAVAAAETDLQNGTVSFRGNEDAETVKKKLAAALLTDYSEETDLSSVEFEYYCEGKTAIGTWGNKSWGSVNGFETQTGSIIKTKYTHPALKDNGDGDYQVRLAGTEAEATVTKATATANIIVNEGASVSLVFNEDASVDFDAVRQAILDQVVAESTPELTLENTTIEYYAENVILGNPAGTKNWMPLEGGTKNLLTYPAIAAGSQNIRLTFHGDDNYAGISKEAVVTIMERQPAVIEAAENPEVALIYNEDMTLDFAAIRQSVLDNVVTASTPELTPENTTIEYYAENVIAGIPAGTKSWMPLEGGTKNLLTYPAIAAGSQKIRITFNGSKDYLKASVEVDVNVTERPEAFTLNEGQSAQLVYADDLSVDYAGLYAEIFEKAVASGEKELTLEDVTIEYYAAPKTNINEAGKQWMPLEGGFYKVPVLGFDVEFEAIKEGTRTIRVSYAGDKDTAPTVKTTDITVLGRPEVEVTLNEAPYETGLVFNEEQGYDYDATAEAIVKTVIASTAPQLSPESFSVEYNASLIDGIKDYKSLNNADITNLKKFGAGNWEIRISWTGTKDYKDGNVVVNVTATDSRVESVVAVKEGASFTYNKDVNVMKQAIFDNVIDWENSALPARETLTVDNFELKYNASPAVEGDFSFDIPVDFVKRFVNIEGELIEVLGQKLGYPMMGAGQQQISIVYKGNAEYRPSAGTNADITVNKAKVSVSVKWTNIFAGQDMPADFVTTNPADNFNVYTIYTGLTSNVALGIYLDLPDGFTDNAIMKVIDPIVNGIFGKTLTQMLNDGMSVGDFRQMFATQELLDALEKLGIDTGAFGQIIKILDATSGIFDGVRISFGTPNRAGLYSAIAVTENKNYETGVGFGTILVRLNSQGVKLNWNQAISGSMTAAQAKEFDFGVTLSQDGDVTIDQSSVSYLYTGLTSSFRLYSSTTTPPTEPGSYIVTVVTLGGNYLAAPITRTFRITK